MNGRTGSMLLVTLVTVTTVTLLALALAAWVGAQAHGMEQLRQRQNLRDACYNAATVAMTELLPGGDKTEIRPEAWERHTDGWVWRVSGRGWCDEMEAGSGLIDESGKIAINEVPAPVLALLFVVAAGESPERAARHAARIVDWIDSDKEATGGNISEAETYGTRAVAWQAPDRPLVALQELYRVPGIAPEKVAAILPWLTLHGGNSINVNSAGMVVLEVVLRAAAAGDEAAVTRLLERLRLFRDAGGCFSSAAPEIMARELGGIAPDEAAMLGRLGAFLGTGSEAFSGVVEVLPEVKAPHGRSAGYAAFIWSCKQRAFVEWVAE